MLDGDQIWTIFTIAGIGFVLAILSYIGSLIHKSTRLEGNGELAQAQDSAFRGLLIAFDIADLVSTIRILIPVILFVLGLSIWSRFR